MHPVLQQMDEALRGAEVRKELPRQAVGEFLAELERLTDVIKRLGLGDRLAAVGFGSDRLEALAEAGDRLRAAERAWAPARSRRYPPAKRALEGEMRATLEEMVRAVRFHCPRRVAEVRQFSGRHVSSFAGLMGALAIAPSYFEGVSDEFGRDATLDVPALAARARALLEQAWSPEVCEPQSKGFLLSHERDRAYVLASRLLRELRRAGHYAFATQPTVAAEFVDRPNANRQKRSRAKAKAGGGACGGGSGGSGSDGGGAAGGEPGA